MKTLLVTLSLLSLTACTGAIGHGAMPAPGPEAFAPSEVVVASTTQGALPAPGPAPKTATATTTR